MSIQHLTYCIQEIVNAKRFLEIPNSDFYKRAVTRLIAIRTDDVLKIGFRVNRTTLNLQSIRDELNGLKVLYEEYFKLQRDKYGAHFQDLDLGARLEAWSNIDLVRAEFFTTVPMEIYRSFATVPDYTALNDPYLTSITAELTILNDKYNFEKFPNIAGDILALTRSNSGGLIHFSQLHTKAGVLKSIELLIDYELELYKRFRDDPTLGEVFAKLFIADLISYADNFITRTDITPAEVQFEYALDHYLDPIRMKEHHDLMSALKKNYKFEEIRNDLRFIRNKVAGHIDLALSVTDIQTMIKDLDLKRYEAFYLQIKNTFYKMCFTGIMLKTFAFSPYEKLHGVVEMGGLPIKTFDGGPIVKHVPTFLDVDDETEYEKQLLNWIADHSKEASSYFWDCCDHSMLDHQHMEEFPLVDSLTTWINIDIRKVHVFLENKLVDQAIIENDKLQILELFIALRSGYPETLAQILIRTYPVETALKRPYLRAIGKLLAKPSQFVFDELQSLLSNKNFWDQYEGLLAIYRIDMRSRHQIFGGYSLGETTYSQALKTALKADRHPWVGLVFNLALAAEYMYGINHARDTFMNTYYHVFEKNILDLVRSIIRPLIRNDKDKRTLRLIEKLFHVRRYVTFLALTADFLEKHKHKVTADRLFRILRGGYIEFIKTDPSELHSYAIASLRLNDVSEALVIARFLVKDHSYSFQHYDLLLQLLLEDRQYESEFLKTKAYVLNNFNLTVRERDSLTAMDYPL